MRSESILAPFDFTSSPVVKVHTAIIFRQARLEDLANIAELHAQSWRENYRQVLSAEYLDKAVWADTEKVWSERLTQPLVNQYILIAEQDAVLCGFICVYGAHHPERGSIVDNLHVNSRVMGQGIGKQLLVSAAQWAVAHYPEQDLYLEVLACNDKAIGFYEAIGGRYVDFACWHTPCGNEAKELIYSWGSPNLLANS